MLPNSGQLSISQVATEFGGSTPHSLSEYYRGGSYVPNSSGTSTIPTSGAIKMSDFYGTSAGASFTGLTAELYSWLDTSEPITMPGFGYSYGFTTTSGSPSFLYPTNITNDSKTVIRFSRNFDGWATIAEVGGFTSNPGQTGWAAGFGIISAMTFPTAAAFYYAYDSGLGIATWMWDYVMGLEPDTFQMFYITAA